MAGDTKRTRNKITKRGNQTVKTRTEESLDVLVGQLEDALPQQFSDKHIDRYFDNQEKVYKYIREDHKDQKDLKKHARKYTLYYIIAFGLILIIFITIIAIANKDSINEFLRLFFAFLGGIGFGGVGTTIVNKKKNSDDD